MSYMLVKNSNDLNFIMNDDIYLSGALDQIHEETYYNYWQISFDNSFFKKLSLKKLHIFLFDILSKRSEQIMNISNVSAATFYIWFDEQSSQLCFNLLSGENIQLPFGCTVNIVDSVDIIFMHCLNKMQYPTIPFEQIEFDVIDDELDENPKKYTLDVWKITLPYQA